MSLTVGCARCHDHKYDPIPTADYYSLYGVFASSHEKLVPIDELPEDGDFRKQYEERRESLSRHSGAPERDRGASPQPGGRVSESAERAAEIPRRGFDQILAVTDILPAFVRRWQSYLHDTRRNRDPIFVACMSLMRFLRSSFLRRRPRLRRSCRRCLMMRFIHQCEQCSRQSLQPLMT